MHTKRHRLSKKRSTRRLRKGGKKGITGAISAAEKKFKKTGSIQEARAEFRKAALTNARKLFGSLGHL
jgi:hypothetical protein